MKTTFLKSLTGVTATMMLASLAGAQVNNAEVEPNDNKATANTAASGGAGMVTGDFISGATTGTSTTAGGTAASADTFRVKTAAAGLGVYRHRLTLNNSQFTATIRGLSQSGGVIGTTDNTLSTAAAVVTGGPKVSQWYGFGKQEEIYFRVAGTTSTTAGYTATLDSQPVTVIALGSVTEGNITVARASGNTTDTDFWVYDSNFNAIATFGNDDPSTVTRALTPGTYYVAISNFNFANNQPSPADDTFRSGTVLDFPNGAANSSTSTNLSCAIAITSNVAGSTSGSATRAGAFDIVFYSFTVTPNTAPTNPSGAGTRSPAGNVDAGASMQFNVAVTPGMNPTSTGLAVTADGSAMGLGTITLFDDGAHGDGAAGDNNFGASVVCNTPGTFTVPFSITDAQARTGAGNFPALTVRTAPPSCPPGQEAQSYSNLTSTAVAGGAGNSIQSFTFTSSDPVLNLHISGRCYAQTTATYRSEAQWRITPPGGSPITVQPNTTTGGGWDSFDVVDRVVSIPGNPAANSGTWTIETFESFDDSGIDAKWNLCIAMEPNNLPTPPAVNGQAANGLAGAAVLLRANVTPGVNPTSTGITVTGDLSTIGGSSSQTFYDDGSNGDATPGDGVYSYLYTLPGATAAATYTLPVSATDAQARTGSGSISLVVDDAGSSLASARLIDGTGPVTSISGVLTSGDVDMFRIHICDPANFNASTVGGSTIDTQLFLFRADGTGVVMNDDEPSNTGGAQSIITNQRVASEPAGDYYLAISAYNVDGRDSANALIFPNSDATGCFGSIYRCQLAPATATALDHWDVAATGNGNYTITLAGVNGETCAPPCPGNQCGPQDYNGDGDFGTDQDIEAFFACLGGNCCATCFCQASDFNGDGDFGTDADIEAFFRVLGGGNC